MQAIHLPDWQPRVSTIQEANDLYFCKSFLKVQSPRQRNWTLNHFATQLLENVDPCSNLAGYDNGSVRLNSVPTPGWLVTLRSPPKLRSVSRH